MNTSTDAKLDAILQNQLNMAMRLSSIEETMKDGFTNGLSHLISAVETLIASVRELHAEVQSDGDDGLAEALGDIAQALQNLRRDIKGLPQAVSEEFSPAVGQ